MRSGGKCIHRFLNKCNFLPNKCSESMHFVRFLKGKFSFYANKIRNMYENVAFYGFKYTFLLLYVNKFLHKEVFL